METVTRIVKTSTGNADIHVKIDGQRYYLFTRKTPRGDRELVCWFDVEISAELLDRIETKLSDKCGIEIENRQLQ